MGQSALKYYVTSERPGQIEQLRNQISTAEDVPALLAAAYAAGSPAQADLWAAAAIDYPSPSIWFHTRLPLAEKLLEQQAEDINRQAGLTRSQDAELPVMVFRPQPLAVVVQQDAEPVAEALAHYRDFVIFADARPQALVRVGSLSGDSMPQYDQLAPLVELVGVNLGVIVRHSGSLETLRLVARYQDRSEEQFFQLLEMVLAEVHLRQEELSLVAIRIKEENGAAAPPADADYWKQVWLLLESNLRELDVPCQVQTGYYIVAMLATSPREAMIAVDRLKMYLQDLNQSYGVRLRTHIGISNWCAGRPGVGQLLWEARQAMEMAAASGAGSPFVYA